MTSPWVARMHMPPPCPMGGDRLLQPGAAGGIQADAGLVEQPERPWAGEQAGEIGAPLLAGGQEASRRRRQPLQVERGQRRVERPAAPPARPAAKPRFSATVSSGFTRVGVADEVEPGAMLGRVGVAVARRPRRGCPRSAAGTRQQPQQGRLAAAVGAAQHQRVAGRQLEATAPRTRAGRRACRRGRRRRSRSRVSADRR